MAASKIQASVRNGGASELNPDSTETSALLHDGEQSSGAQIIRKPSWDGYQDFIDTPAWRRPSVYWLLPFFLLFTLAFGGIIVPKLNLLLALVCREYLAEQDIHYPDANGLFKAGLENPQCKIPEVKTIVQKSVAEFMLAMNFLTGLLSAFIAPKLGQLSDRYGRTRLMALASCGGLIAELITIICAKFPDTISYRWILVGSIFDGLTGSFTAGSILGQSYTSDATPPSKRAVAIGYIHASLFCGLAFGPLLAGYFVEWTGTLISIFYVSFVCHMLFILGLFFIVPESLSPRRMEAAKEKWRKEKQEQRQHGGSLKSTIQAANPLRSLRILWPKDAGTTPALRRNLVALALSDFIIMGSAMAAGSCIILYSELTFDWGNFESSRFVSALSMVRVFVLMGIFPLINYFARVRPAARRLKETGVAVVDRNAGADRLDIWIIRIALVSDILGCVGYIFARNESLFFASGMVTALGGLGSATVQATITKHVPSERIGQVLGAVGMNQAIARVVGPVAFNGLYAATVRSFPQAIFVLLCCIYGIGLAGSLVIRPHIHWEESVNEVEPLNPAAQLFDVNEQDRLPLDDDQVRIL